MKLWIICTFFYYLMLFRGMQFVWFDVFAVWSVLILISCNGFLIDFGMRFLGIELFLGDLTSPLSHIVWGQKPSFSISCNIKTVRVVSQKTYQISAIKDNQVIKTFKLHHMKKRAFAYIYTYMLHLKNVNFLYI